MQNEFKHYSFKKEKMGIIKRKKKLNACVIGSFEKNKNC